MYIPAIAGPTAPPIRLRSTVIPRDIPLNCLGVDSKIVLNPPTWVNDNPVAIIASVPATIDSVEWKRSILKNPIVLIMLPMSVGLMFPNLDK